MSDAAPVQVDARGLLCPLPVIRTQDTIKALCAGAVVVVFADDPGALADIPAWCRVHGHQLLMAGETEGVFEFRILVRA